jgi:Tol biopolymer transport system component
MYSSVLSKSLLLAITIIILCAVPSHVSADESGVIVFESNRDGDFELYGISAGGAGVLQLTSNTWSDTSPAVSPDGSQIAFVSYQDDVHGRISVMNADGTGVAIISGASLDAGNPAWSPDGSRIAYTSYLGDGSELRVMNADGSNDHSLAGTVEIAADRSSWSPDGSELAFDAAWPLIRQIISRNMSTGAMRCVTSGQEDATQPCFSRSSGMLVFSSTRGEGSSITVINSDGSHQRDVTTATDLNDNPTWSPDGTKISFDSNRAGGRDIYIVNADGTGLVRTTDNPAIDWHPSWGLGSLAPLTGSLLFESDRDGDFEIYRTNADGTGSWNQLTHNTWDDETPCWLDHSTGRFLYVTDEGGLGQLYAANSDGSGGTRITDGIFNYRVPCVSPDGMELVYEIRDLNSSGEIGIATWVFWDMDANKWNPIPPPFSLPTTADAHAFSYSPDKNYLAFEDRSGPGRTYEICVARRGAAPGEYVRLTDNIWNDVSPEWSPDGKKIVFQSDRDGEYEIYVMNADGTGESRVTTGGGHSPSWSKDSQTIYYAHYVDGHDQIFSIRPDGTGEREVGRGSGEIRSTDGTGYTIGHLTWSRFNGTSPPAPVLIPGGTGIPRDLDGDGKYEDVNGNGRKDFADVTLYFTQMTWIGANEPLAAFDYNGNGRIDFADVTWLFRNL